MTLSMAFLRAATGVAAGLGTCTFECAVNDALCGGLLAVDKNLVDQLRDQRGSRKRDRKLAAASGAGPLRGILLLLHLCAVTAASLLAVLYTLGVECAADDLVADTRKVLNTTTTNEHDGVLLEVVANTGGM